MNLSKIAANAARKILLNGASGPAALTKVRVNTVREIGYYVSHGFALEYEPRGNRFFMVRPHASGLAP